MDAQGLKRGYTIAPGISGRPSNASNALVRSWRLFVWPTILADQGIGRFPPFSGRLLARQDEATGTRVRELNKASRHELVATPRWIEQRLSGHRDGRGITNSDPVLQHM